MTTATLQYRMGASSFTDPLIVLLDELADVIDRLSDERYAQRPVGVIPSSIGGHVRHCLDHVSALLGGAVTGRIDYDHRARGTPIETSRHAALDSIADLRHQLAVLPHSAIDLPVQLIVMMSSDGPKLPVRSSIGREVSYVLSHTIHHNALIGTMVKTLGGWVPERFGYAPSTVAHQQQRLCAQSA